jgi:LDH2 family malate/lactate/ureidoglycolate dehydrogenase
MKSRMFATLSVAALALVACGGGDDSQGEVADMMIEEMEAEGMEVDEDCVRDAAGQLSDDDAEKIAEAGPDGEPQDLSPEAMAAASALVNCVDMGSLIDDAIDDMVSEMGEDNVDADCIREATADLDLANPDQNSSALMTAMLDCINIGG